MKVETQMIVKRFFFALLVLILLTLSLALPVFAHSGKTDSKGGHYDHSTGEYHYHHGYPEHQHKNGVCPYEQRKKVDNTVEIVIAVVVGIPIAFFLLYGLVISPLSDKYKKANSLIVSRFAGLFLKAFLRFFYSAFLCSAVSFRAFFAHFVYFYS